MKGIVLIFLATIIYNTAFAQIIHYTTFNSGLVSNNVSSIGIDSLGNIWIGTWFNGVSKFDGTNWTTYTTANGLVSNSVQDISIDAQNNIWFGTANGVSVFDGTTWKSYTTADGLCNNSITAIAFDLNGNKWLVSNYNGVSMYNDTIWTNYSTADGLVNNEVFSIGIDSNGNKWFGTNDGVSKFDGVTWTTYNQYNSPLVGYSIYPIGIDQQDNVWFGMQGGNGVSKFDGVNWTIYNPGNSGITDGAVFSIATDPLNSNVWLGTTGGSQGIVNMFDGTDWTYYELYSITDIAIDAQGNKWFAGDGVHYLSHCGIPFEETICIVTVDELTNKNKVIWEKTGGVGISSINVYKETGANLYDLIGNVPFDSANYFIDQGSVPETHGDKYKISVIDTCNNESSFSSFHKTINLTVAMYGSTAGLNWDEYIDSSEQFVPLRYYIYRGTQPDNLVLYDSISSSFTSYNDNNVFVQYYYMVSVKKPGGCSSTKNNISESFSNKKLNFGSAVNESEIQDLSIYPNPANNLVIINTQEKSTIEILNLHGKIIDTKILSDKTNYLDISDLRNGIYTLRILTDKGIAIRKLIKQ